jgi:hypothetical protein
LLVPRRHAEEVGFLAAEPVHCEQEVGDLAVVAEILDLDIGRQVSRQHDTVHASSFVCCGGNIPVQMWLMCAGSVAKADLS